MVLKIVVLTLVLVATTQAAVVPSTSVALAAATVAEVSMATPAAHQDITIREDAKCTAHHFPSDPPNAPPIYYCSPKVVTDPKNGAAGGEAPSLENLGDPISLGSLSCYLNDHDNQPGHLVWACTDPPATKSKRDLPSTTASSVGATGSHMDSTFKCHPFPDMPWSGPDPRPAFVCPPAALDMAQVNATDLSTAAHRTDLKPVEKNNHRCHPLHFSGDPPNAEPIYVCYRSLDVSV